MAWRPHEYLIEGELDNTVPGKVTGWMEFAGLPQRVTFDLRGDFHRDIRGSKVRLKGTGRHDDPQARAFMDRFSLLQTGDVGDMTAGLPPQDYTKYPYIEWYGDKNGRVVIELDAEQVQVIGQPLPPEGAEPISRAEQGRKMAAFLGRLSVSLQVPAVAVGGQPLQSDPTFSHWIIAGGRVIGEARDVGPDRRGSCPAILRLFPAPEGTGRGRIGKRYLQPKAASETGSGSGKTRKGGLNKTR